jgi:chemotaxis protein MotB
MPGPEVIIIKKKPKGHAAHSAAWKVAYADFVTAMMALFMVLWLVSQTDQAIKKSISDYFRTGVFSGAPSVLEGGSGVSDRGFVDTAENPLPIEPVVLQRNAEAMRAAVSRALARPELKGLSDKVTVRATEDGILVQIADGRDDLLFDSSSAALKPALTELLTALAPTLTEIGYQLEMHGHTDARPFPAGSSRNNWTLSFERAESARAELVKAGVPPDLIRGVYAHGSTVLADEKDPSSPRNRRLAIFARRVATAAATPDVPQTPRIEPGKPDPSEPARGQGRDGRTGKLERRDSTDTEGQAGGAVGAVGTGEPRSVAARERPSDLR